MEPIKTVFSQGEPISGEIGKNFTGQAFLEMLVPGDDIWRCPIGNVTFEPGCRNNWHRHPGGQILLVTAGKGWYQEEGKAARELLPGDVVKIPPDVKHWHGAQKDSGMAHLSIETNSHKGSAQWLEPVADEEYRAL